MHENRYNREVPPQPQHQLAIQFRRPFTPDRLNRVPDGIAYNRGMRPNEYPLVTCDVLVRPVVMYL